MAILPVEKEILTFIKSYSEDNNDYRYRSIILPERRVKELDGIITALVSSELKNKKIPIEKLSSYIVFDSWELTPTDKIKNKPQRWERHYKENISLLVLYFEYIKKTIENDGRISELELEYIAKNIRDTLLQYINFKTEYEELIHNLRYDPPAGIVQIDRSTIKHIKLKSYLVRNCHYAPRELIPPVAFEVRQIIVTKIYNSFGLRFVIG